MAANRKGFDCSLFPAHNPCEFKIWGEGEEVLESAVEHAADFHGYRDTPALRDQLRSMLRDDRRPRKAA